jgi:hypothetical protein
VDDQFNGMVVIWLTGALKGQGGRVSDFDGTNKRFTVSSQNAAPADNDWGKVV